MHETSKRWRSYFESNATRKAELIPENYTPSVPPQLHGALLRTIKRLHLGECGEGRIVLEAYRSADPSLDEAMRRCIDLYIHEEHRHAVEVESIIRSLGGEPLDGHWSSKLFSKGRRVLGLRTKMITMAAAEVVGVEAYQLIVRYANDPKIVEIARRIASEESGHLRFQSEWFARALETSTRPGYRIAFGAWYSLIQVVAVALFIADHGPLLKRIGVRRGEFSRRCLVRGMAILGRAISTSRKSNAPFARSFRSQEPLARQSRAT